jgi:small subunit ribosomal protein S16
MLSLVWPGEPAWPLIRQGALEKKLPPAGKNPKDPGPPRTGLSPWGGKDSNRALDFERNRIAVVMIRLARFGARKQPYYRIVAIEKDRARNGRSIEVVGTYNPRTSPATVDLKHERIAYWRSVGAQFSTIVEKLVAKNPAQAAGETPADAPLTPVGA